MKTTPFYVKVADMICCQIYADKMREGDFLPTEDQMACSLHVSRSTIRKAVKHLEEHQVISAVKGKKRCVLQEVSAPAKRTRTVLCIGSASSNFSVGDNQFHFSGYDCLYNSMVEEFQKVDIIFPKVVVDSDGKNLPELVYRMDYQAAFFITSLSNEEITQRLNCRTVQNMQRYEKTPDLVISYDSESLAIQVAEELLNQKSVCRFLIYYQDIRFPFLDHILNGFLRGIKLYAAGRPIELRYGKYREGAIAADSDCLEAEAVLICGHDVKDYFFACQESGITIPEKQIVVSIGSSGLQALPNRAHCRSFPINYRKIASVAVEVIANILDNAKHNYNISIPDWYLSQGEY